ncbi:MAG: hypothetical protein H6832_13025 [Planctomycetes bacterium]|nr:hypothetical protein [Planctomycetota bacterium]
MAVIAATLAGITPCVRTQADWSAHKVLANPASSTDFAVASDVRRSLMVLFGGSGSNDTDTWLFDGSLWRSVRNPVAPPSRAGHRLEYGIVRNTCLLFGGRSWDYLDDTWEWDGNRWIPRTTNHSPPARADFGLTFEVARGRHLLFGGKDDRSVFDDTWSFDGSDWTRLTPLTSPTARVYPSMAYDSHRARVVLFGGHDREYLDDTWEWDGTDWKQIQPTSRPPARRSAGMAYDRFRRVIVLHGGIDDFGARRDTWEFDGSTWSQRRPQTTPPASWQTVLAYDSARNRTTLFGPNTIWSYSTNRPAAAVSYSTGCGSLGAIPQTTCDRLPWLGRRLVVDTDNVAANRLALLVLGVHRDRFGSRPLPWPIDSHGMPGCALATSIEAAHATTTLGGRARWSIPVENQPLLAGRRLFAQAFVFDPSANQRGIAVSNALDLTIGVL